MKNKFSVKLIMLTNLLLIICMAWLVYITYFLIKTRKDLDEKSDDNHTWLTKIGLVRFNPFGNTGGDQSFCMALLIRRNLGIIITSLHGRNGTRVYAKEIDLENMDKKKMSAEEKEAIKKALKIEDDNEK